MRIRRLWLLLSLSFAAILVQGCDGSSAGERPSTPVYSLSVSSNGRYVVSTHGDRRLVLWDLVTRTRRVLSSNANIYSARFVRGRPLFIWQDLEKVVHLQSTSGEEISRWALARDTYGHLLSPDLKTYVYSDEGYGVHVRLGEKEYTLKRSDPGTFLGTGKLFNLDLSPDGGTILSAGDCSPYFGTAEGFSPERQAQKGYRDYECLILWDIKTYSPLAKLPGNIAKTYATFSPDGKYVVSGDENGHCYVWNTASAKKLFRLASLRRGILVDTSKGPGKFVWDNRGLIPRPKDYNGEAVISFKFIDLDNHYLRITANQHYAILYAIDNPLPLKYLDLGTKPYPATREYARNTAIDSAPAAGILVTGQANGPGINVYRYDKTTRTLKRIWVAR